MLAFLAAVTVLTVLTALTLACYGVYRAECATTGETPVKWFGR
jgi:hypothetical protein